VKASQSTARRVPERPRPNARWVSDRLVIVDFRAEARRAPARRLRRAGLVLSGLAVSGGLSVAGLALHHLLGG
jgi:hypothetical protein